MSQSHSIQLSNSESCPTEDFLSATDQLSISSEGEDKETVPIYIETCANISSVSVSKEHPVRIITVFNSFEQNHLMCEETSEKQEFLKFNMASGMADQVYEGAKSAWSFGKGVRVLNPIMGLAEGVATKALSVTVGVDDLESADTLIRERLNTLDKDIVDPTIHRMWEVIGPFLEKSDGIVQSFIGMTRKKIPIGGEKNEIIPLDEVTAATIAPTN